MKYFKLQEQISEELLNRRCEVGHERNEHLNRNIICSIDIKTTGPDPQQHDIYDLAIIVLDPHFSREPNKHILDLLIKPSSGNIDEQVLARNRVRIEAAQADGYSTQAAKMLFYRWLEDLNLDFNKKIIPVGYNYAHEQSFLIEWLGRLNYHTHFDETNIRDPRIIARFMNDLAYARSQEFPFKKVTQQWLCKQLDVWKDYGIERAAIHDAAIGADMYKGIMKRFLREMIL